MTTNKSLSKLEALARIVNAASNLGLIDALDAWHRAGYGPVPGWALDMQIKRNPPTWAEYKRTMGEKD